MRTQTKAIQEHLTPADAKRILTEGNQRFTANVKAQRNLQSQVFETSAGQFPFAVILSCIDSRVPAELVFDQGIGDIFSTRVAGNIINEDVLGSMEYACAVAGSKIVVVMGHTKCGAVTSACNRVEMGNITALLSKIKPAVDKVHPAKTDLTDAEIEEVSIENVKHSIDEIRAHSPILANLEKEGKIAIVGANYSVDSGEVHFM
ncbi:carbonic anhydrase [Putridiphycobacter roseus]|uniref:Carbonic anhydrase n=1 Tax=Putridiphycobacter roseus TaxID=2219161 RepID=A0A2W1NG58_9FLAO|nr:carbonic anhydrase family protein [Putridiphycobacter roseus]PZE18083.1 carbonic anhydrase [Putridiphycobacter roseus]